MAVAGDFDIYLLAQSWAPAFCCENPDKCSALPWNAAASHLSLHGLWPGYGDRRNGSTFPESCELRKKQLQQAQLPLGTYDLAPAYVQYDRQVLQPPLAAAAAAAECGWGVWGLTGAPR